MNLTINTADDLLGKTIAGYTLTRVLGTGSVGVVLLGEHPSHLTEAVAIKVCLPPLNMLADERAIFQARFLREAEIVQRLQHPHIVPVLQHGVERGLLYTIFRFMEGGTLAERQTRRIAPLPLAEVCHILTQLADALDAAHAAGIIHRDVKPTNILFDQPEIFAQHEQFSVYDDAYLGDFSIVHLQQDAATTLTMTGQILGTLAYMAPEQANGESLTPAADIYSLGIIAYELITGQPPFVGTTPVQILWQLVQTVPTSPRQARPDLPEAAEAAVLQALAKAPTDRFVSAGAFAAAFTRGLQGEWTTPQPIAVADMAPLFLGAMDATALPNADDMSLTDDVPPLRHKRVKRGIAIVVVIILITLAFVQGRTLLAFSRSAPSASAAHTGVARPATAPATQTTQAAPPISTPVPATAIATINPLPQATNTPQPIPTATLQPAPIITPLRVNLLLNPGFEGDGGWATSANSFNESGGHDSKVRHTHWNPSAAFSAFTAQNVDHLTPGTYQASAWIQTPCGNAGNKFAIIDTTNNSQLAEYDIPGCPQVGWVSITIQARVSRGQVQVIFTSNNGPAQWLRIDDVTFMRLS